MNNVKLQTRRLNPVEVMGDVTEPDGSLRKLVKETVSEFKDGKLIRKYDNVYRVHLNLKFLAIGDHPQDVIQCPHEAEFVFILKRDGVIEAINTKMYPGDGIQDLLADSLGYRFERVSIKEGEQHGKVLN